MKKLRESFGTAGLVVAIVALVAALGGGAYAAAKGGVLITNINQIKKSVQNQLKGKTGPQGPAGANGKDGASGSNGAPGKDGAPGDDGDSVDSAAASVAECPDGGTKFTVGGAAAGKACNGAEGSPWTATGTLPSGKTETGFLGWAQPAAGNYFVPISFNVPIAEGAEPLTLVFVPALAALEPEEQEDVRDQAAAEGCPGIDESIPQADPGKVCVYAMNTLNSEVPGVSFTNNADGSEPEGGVGPSGAALAVVCTAACQFYGAWAATAE
jgi:hypothetical protein